MKKKSNDCDPFALFTDLKNCNSALVSTSVITCIKSALLKMYINAGSISSSLKSKHHILFYTLNPECDQSIPASYIIILFVPRDTRLGRLYKMSAECITKRKCLTWWENKFTCFPSFRGRGIHSCLLWPSLSPFVRTFHRKAP